MSLNLTPSITISGSLITQDSLPLHGRFITICLVIKCFLGEYEEEICKIITGKKGEFKFSCQYSELCNSKVVKVILKVSSVTSSKNIFNKCPGLIFDTLTIISNKVLRRELKGLKTFDLMALKVNVLEYDNRESAHNYYQPKNLKHILKPENDLFKDHLFKSTWPDYFKSQMLKMVDISSQLFNTIDITTKDVQRIFGKPENSLEHDIETLKEMIFSFYSPNEEQLEFIITNELEEKSILKWNFDNYEKEPNNEGLRADLPNLIIVFQKVFDKNNYLDDLKIEQITLQYSKNKQAQTFLPIDKKFAEAIKAACHVILFAAMAETHFGRGHRIPAVFTMAFLKHFIHSPIAELLAPFMEGVLRINQLHERTIYNKKHGLLGMCALSQKGIEHFLNDVVELANYEEETPHRLFKKDTFGIIKNQLYFTLLKGVRAFIQDNIDEIKKHKHEIYYAGLCLEEHSKNLKKFMNDQDTLDSSALEKLEKALTYFMYNIAHHHLTHEAEKKWALDVSFATLAPHYDITDENLDENMWDSIYSGTQPYDAIRQLSIVHTLVNEDKYLKEKSLTTHPDMVKHIIEAFETDKKVFKKLGVDPSKIACTPMY